MGLRFISSHQDGGEHSGWGYGSIMSAFTDKRYYDTLVSKSEESEPSKTASANVNITININSDKYLESLIKAIKGELE